MYCMSHLQVAQERVCAVDCKWSDWGDWEGRAQVLMVDHQQHSTRKSEKSVEHDYFVQNCIFFFSPSILRRAPTAGMTLATRLFQVLWHWRFVEIPNVCPSQKRLRGGLPGVPEFGDSKDGVVKIVEQFSPKKGSS